MTIHKNWQELIRPNKFDVKPVTTRRRRPWSPSRSSAGSVDLGNALRRVLLSSFPGRGGDRRADRRRPARVLLDPSASDVTDIILNIKEIR